MRYRDLIYYVRKYHERFGEKGETEIYPKSVSPNYINWDNMQSSDLDRVFYFLNVWGNCRLKCTKDEFLRGYSRAYLLLKPFKNLILEYFNDFEQLIDIETEHIKAKRIINLAYDELMDIRGFGPVPTSKMFHLLAPSFFVMWDNAISKMYKLRLNGYNYANMFLPKMQKEIEEAIKDFMEINGLERGAAINSIYDELREICGSSRSLAKSIDEFNWMKAHPNRV